MKPKYEEIADTIRERIKNNVYKADTLLPNQTDLVKEFDVSRMTVKKAIGILVMEGLLYSQRGSGTKVLNRSFWDKDTSPANEYGGLSKQMDERHKNLKSQVILFEVEFPTQEVQERLAISEEQPVYKIIRLRILENEPFILEHTYMPCDLVPGLTTDILKKSIYTYVKEELSLNFAGAYRNIQASKSDEYDQNYLNCKIDDPVLEVQQVVYLKNGRPIEFSCSRNRYDQRGYSILNVDYN
ncbi:MULTISPECIES: GntR family transcriptional regulator [unclassified Enterococcus]|uniref:GntR family transcriptional regulator n=1 Tax=unclassified Enterococcus TaxID=2608891 RepID=UPI001CE1CFCC|nr:MULTISPECIES: GntR family transcriptional regulator [unclassified Enterococcus]MCA5013962.1 GntR family transcriptional regulator [Enterococcus sp. S23]MCA5017264.1 GntR family transcriptional regulator [Enterococcus sp. S22(2020)]